MATHIFLAKADDWIGVYKDEWLVWQGHSLPEHMLLEVLGIEHGLQWFEGELEPWGGAFPDSLVDLIGAHQE